MRMKAWVLPNWYKLPYCISCTTSHYTSKALCSSSPLPYSLHWTFKGWPLKSDKIVTSNLRLSCDFLHPHTVTANHSVQITSSSSPSTRVIIHLLVNSHRNKEFYFQIGYESWENVLTLVAGCVNSKFWVKTTGCKEPLLDQALFPTISYFYC